MIDEKTQIENGNGKVKFLGVPCDGCTKRKEILEAVLGKNDTIVLGIVVACVIGIVILKYYQVKSE